MLVSSIRYNIWYSLARGELDLTLRADVGYLLILETLIGTYKGNKTLPGNTKADEKL